MTYPFISLLPLVQEVQDELKRIVRTSSFTEQDCYGWAVSFVRLIGGNNYEPCEVRLQVKRHSAALPEDFYALQEITRCAYPNCVTACKHTAWGETCPQALRVGLMPADKATWAHCSRRRFRRPAQWVDTYTLKCPPGIGRFSFAEGTVLLCYEALKRDTDGTILIQDEEYGILGCKNYIKQQMLQERWVLGEVKDSVYLTFKQDAEAYLEKARIKQLFPDGAETARRSHDQDHRYSKFNYRRQ